MRTLAFVLIASLPAATGALACSCSTTGSACAWLKSTEVVFMGRVIVDSGEGHGSGPARMVVEELLHGLPKDIEQVTVNTLAGTSCYMRLQKNERYVIYGTRVPGSNDKVNRSACSFSFQVAGNEALLSALREAQAGGSPRLVGKVQMKYEEYDVRGEGAAGVRVVATGKNGRQLETATKTNGEFEFLNVEAGKYHLAVESSDVVEDRWRWPKEDPVLAGAGCGYQNLYVWPNGRIEGSVRDADGKPAAGVPVQAFLKDQRGQLDSSAVREAKTDQAGAYVLNGLPPGDVVVGVNGNKYDDRQPWRPTFYGGVTDGDKATKIVLGRGQKIAAIDLQLPSPRTAATLYIETVLEDGSPAPEAGANIRDLAGHQRASASGLENHTNVLAVPVYVGETYMIDCFRFSPEPATIDKSGAVRMRSRSWKGQAGPIPVSATDVRVRVILKEEHQ